MARRSITIALISLAVLACQLGPREDLPAAGVLYITAEPAAAQQRFGVEIRDPAGDLQRAVSWSLGARVIGQMAALPGEYTVSTSLGCAFHVTLKSGVETDVVFSQAEDDCSLASTGEHPPGEMGHSLAAVSVTLLDGNATSDTTIAVESLDDPPNPVPSPIAGDENGDLIFPDGLVPGSYRFVARAGDETIGERVVTVRPEPAMNEVVIDIGHEP